ncbi:MAG: serine hydrolase domain-containing protein [Cyclobacteriaceae bacterium]
MKNLCLVTGLICPLWLCYFLFQNIIDYNFGWKNLPTDLFEYSFEGKADDTYLIEIMTARAELREIHRVSNAPAVSIAVSIDGKTVWSEALGLKDIQEKIPADTSTQFRIGSTSKALTSLALGRLLEEKVIHLDSSIQFYTNHFQRKPKISIRQLASHQSGIRNYSVCLCLPIWEYYRDKYFFTVEESLHDFEDDPLLFPPGDDFAYSTYNFTALSHAMEEAASTNFLALIKRQVLNPLAMRSTQPNLKHHKSSTQSEFYDIRNNEFRISSEVDLSNKWGGGGFMSTPSDLVKAGEALLSDSFLSKATIKLITTPQTLSDGSENSQRYALGWRNQNSTKILENAEVQIIHHGGVAVGSQSLLVVLPEYKMVVSLLLNKSKTDSKFKLFDYLYPIAEIFIKEIELKQGLR